MSNADSDLYCSEANGSFLHESLPYPQLLRIRVRLTSQARFCRPAGWATAPLSLTVPQLVVCRKRMTHFLKGTPGLKLGDRVLNLPLGHFQIFLQRR